MMPKTIEQTLETLTPETLAQLEDHIQARLSGLVRNFRLQVASGGVLLQGQARTYYAKQMATQAVLEVAHLPIAANDIQVT